MPLSDRDQAILHFERHWAVRDGRKDLAIRDELGLSPSRFYAARDRLLDDPEALAADPLLVRRLRRDRVEARRRRHEGPRPTRARDRRQGTDR